MPCVLREYHVKEFRCQVLLEGLEIGEYCSDFVATKMDDELMVRECVYRKHLSKPMTAKLLDASRNYWRRSVDTRQCPAWEVEPV